MVPCTDGRLASRGERARHRGQLHGDHDGQVFGALSAFSLAIALLRTSLVLRRRQTVEVIAIVPPLAMPRVPAFGHRMVVQPGSLCLHCGKMPIVQTAS